MENIYLFSDDATTIRTGYDDRGQRGYELARLSIFVQERDIVEKLWNIHPQGRCFLWGARETEENYLLWREMEAGDFILGVRGETITSSARVLMKLKAPGLAAGVWDGEIGAPFSLICFLDEPRIGETAIAPALRRYLDAGVRELEKVPAERRDGLIGAYMSVSNFIRLGLGFDFPFSLRHSE